MWTDGSTTEQYTLEVPEHFSGKVQYDWNISWKKIKNAIVIDAAIFNIVFQIPGPVIRYKDIYLTSYKIKSLILGCFLKIFHTVKLSIRNHG